MNAKKILVSISCFFFFGLGSPKVLFHPHFSPAQMLKRVREIDAVLGFSPPKTQKEKALLLEEQGMMLNALGRMEEAIVAWEKALKLCPDDPRLYYSYASMLLSKDIIPKAIKLLEKAVKLDPKEINYASLLAQAYEKAGDFEKAAKIWETAGEKEKDPLVGAEHLGSAARAALKAKNFDKAIYYLNKALKKSKGEPQWLYEKAMIYKEEKKFLECANELLKAVKASNGTQGDEFAWLIQAGEAFLKAGKKENAETAFKEAIKLINKLLKEDPAFAEDLFFHKAKALYFLGKYKEAEKNLLKALDILPGEPPYLELGLKIFQKTGNKKEYDNCINSLKIEKEKDQKLREEEKKDKARRTEKYLKQLRLGNLLWKAWLLLMEKKDPSEYIRKIKVLSPKGKILALRIELEWLLKENKVEEFLKKAESLPKTIKMYEPWFAVLKVKAMKRLGKEAKKEKELIKIYLESAGR